MTSLLFIISFLLHIVLIIIVYQLYQQLQEIKNGRQQELEQLFSTFLEEIKTENNQLKIQLASHYDNMASSQKNRSRSQSPSFPQMKEETSLPILNIKKEDKVETSASGQIFQLFDGGNSIEDIAKKTNRGKTEVELILKLQKRNETN